MDRRQQFIQQMMPYAIEASKRTGVDPRIIVAQAALESNYGQSAPGNNFFGIKSHGREGGQTLNTTEYGSGGAYKTADSFRQYGSMGESADDYARFITENKRYAPLREAQGLDAQLAALQRSGYATDPQYSSKVGSIARAVGGDLNSYTPPQQQAAAPATQQAADPVYKNDLQTFARYYGNKLFPDQIEAPTPLTADEAKTQMADMAESAGYAKAAGGLLNLAKLLQEKPQPEQEISVPMPERRRVAFRPLPMMRGLL